MERFVRHLRTVVAATVAATALLHGAPAAAVTINASFAPIRLTAKPGEVLTAAYQLKLQDGEPTARFKAEIQDWWRSEDGQQSFYAKAGSLGRSCGLWVVATPKESAVSGGEALQVRLTVTVPATVKPGGYWCALTLDETPDPHTVTPDGVGVRFLASVSTGIYVFVSPVERAVDIASVDVSEDRATARLVNVGNAPVTVEGRYEFFKIGQSEPFATIEFPRNALLTEPIATGTYSVALPPASQLPSGRYRVRLILDIGLDHYIGVQRELDIRRAVPTGSPH
jgi:hypothetical protein